MFFHSTALCQNCDVCRLHTICSAWMRYSLFAAVATKSCVILNFISDLCTVTLSITKAGLWLWLVNAQSASLLVEIQFGAYIVTFICSACLSTMTFYLFFSFSPFSQLHPLRPCTLHFPLDLFPILPSQPANIFLSLFSPSHLYILSFLPTYFAVYLRLYTMSSCCPPFCPSSLSYSALSLKHCRGNLIWVYLVFRRIPFSCQLSLPPDTKTNRACPAKSSKHCWCWLHYLVFTFQMNPTALHFLFVPFLWA